MAERFTGTFDELKSKLKDIPGDWKDLNPSQKQLRAASGGILNWYPATGSIMFQGKSPALEALRDAVVVALAAAAPSAPTTAPDAATFPARPAPAPAVVKPVTTSGVKGAAQAATPESRFAHTTGGFHHTPSGGSGLVSPAATAPSAAKPPLTAPATAPTAPKSDAAPVTVNPAATSGVEGRLQVAPPDSESAPTTGGFLSKPFADSELVFALIGAVGTELEKVRSILEDRLKVVGYGVTQVRITKDVIPTIVTTDLFTGKSEYERLKGLMDAGNEARRASGDNSILALGAAAFINSMRKTDPAQNPEHEPRRAYIISSLKHPEEVARLRDIYPQGFYLIGVHADEKRRYDYLTRDKNIPPDKANELIDRDKDENLPHGQKVTDTFHLSDFFVRIDGHDDCVKHGLWRILNLLFGHPYVTPTFDEYAMFLAFAASLRSADLSRQVGAVVAVDDQVVATGANDCPKAGGGLYWPEYNEKSHEIEDQEDGRDYMRGEDSNKIEQQKIIEEILARAAAAGLDRGSLEAALRGSRIRDLTEFGRVVHAEMEALLSCGRAQIPMKHGTVYTTTFPCHNCAKHIVAAGISRVVYIEPYQKSKAAEFHTDSIQVGFTDDATLPSDGRQVVSFEPFVGVGPRRFFDLFSVRLGSGYPLKRKDAGGHTIPWKPDSGRLRLQMIPVSYLDLELVASDMFHKASARKKESPSVK